MDLDFSSNVPSDNKQAAIMSTRTENAASARKSAKQGAWSPLPDTNTNTINLATASTLGDIAKVLRSKNAGPYEIALDVLFDRREIFDIVRNPNILTRETIAGLFDLHPEQVIRCGFFEQAVAFKATIPRMRKGKPTASGGFMENDVHEAQMYVPLMELELPGSVKEEIRAL